jgi:hypothetical protein
MTTQSRKPSGETAAVADELKGDAARLKGDVAARARREAESRKSQAAQLAGSASSALDTAARDLRENPDAPDWMASALQQAARSIDNLARHVEGRSIDQIGREVAGLARRNPGTFLAASAALGFAASWVLRAGVQRVDAQNSRAASENFADWPADEYVRPTASGGYEPAFFANEPGTGGTRS